MSAAELGRVAKEHGVSPEEFDAFKMASAAVAPALSLKKPILPAYQIASIASDPTQNATLDNGGLEMGTLKNWCVWGGYYNVQNGLRLAPMFMRPQTASFSKATPVAQKTALSFVNVISKAPNAVPIGGITYDNIFPSLLKVPFPGQPNQFVLRLGNGDTHGGGSGAAGSASIWPSFTSAAEAAAFKFRVTKTNYEFKFRYAVVHQDPRHAPTDEPRFIFQLIDLGTQGFPAIDAFESVPLHNQSYHPQGRTWDGCPTVFKPITTYSINLSQYNGRDVLAVFVNTDCAKGGHSGYTYIDGLGE